MEQLAANKCFGGVITKYKATSSSLGGLATQFNVFLPKESESSKVPVLYYLAGLTCTEDTAPWKAGFLRDAAAEGIAMVFPDTSPRGANIDGEDKDWDFGTGAGFYLNATKAPYKGVYNMYDFVVKELPEILAKGNVPIDGSKRSVFGHSMGGHGALVTYLSELDSSSPFLSASAFAPITNPTNAPWGHKAFDGYLEGGKEEGKRYDAAELIKALPKGKTVNILVDSGTADNFYKQGQLLPENFTQAASEASFGEDRVKVNLRDGYDHSYYFISTFGPDHIKFHAKFLKR